MYNKKYIFTILLSNFKIAVFLKLYIGNVELRIPGNIEDTVKIQGKTDHFSILVFIPGTLYILTTDSTDSYSLKNVPARI